MDFLIQSSQGFKVAKRGTKRKDKHASISNTSVSLPVEGRVSNTCLSKKCSRRDEILILSNNRIKSSEGINRKGRMKEQD